jgi:arginase family enzyme
MFAPAVSHPSPGGLSLEEMTALVIAVGRAREVVGVDVMELDPGREAGPVTAIVACHVLLAALGAIAERWRDTDASRGR